MNVMPELLEKGDLIGGRYQIARYAGSGGGSHVYIASDLKLPGKFWAVKQTAAERGVSSLLLEEAAMLIALDHPRLPRIVDFFQGAAGKEDVHRGREEDLRAGSETERLNEISHWFLVMDYIEGTTLEEYLRRNKEISHQQLLLIADQICDGLHYLHTREPPIIYRDLKPTNLMMEEEGGIRFIDFGTARVYKPEISEDTVQLGTVGFAAPEQYLGRQSDARTDLYALGAIMLYLLTNGEHTQWPKDDKALDQKPFPRDLVKMIRKLLSFDTADRFQNAIEVKRELQRMKRINTEEFHRPADPSDRPVVVALTGASEGIGTTHLSLMIAYTFSRFYSDITYVDWNDRSSAAAGLQTSFDDDLVVSGRRLEYRQLTIYKKPSRAEWLQLLGSGHKLIVLDMGVKLGKEGQEEFSRADLQIVVVPAAVWRRDEISLLIPKLSSLAGRKRVFAAPFADSNGIEQIGRLVKSGKVFTVPVEPDPFYPGELSMQAVVKICGTLLPNPEVKKKWMPGWLKKTIVGSE